MGVEFGPQGGHQRAGLLVERAFAAELPIVLGHFEHPLARNILAAQDILEEWQHVVRAFGSAECDDQHRVVRLCHRATLEGAKIHRRAGTAPGPRPRASRLSRLKKMTPTGFEPVLSA